MLNTMVENENTSFANGSIAFPLEQGFLWINKTILSNIKLRKNFAQLFQKQRSKNFQSS